MKTNDEKVTRSDAEWREILSPAEYRILRQKDTERPFTGEYWNTREAGVYVCRGCGQELYSSEAKFDSGCGWPSFSAAADGEAIRAQADVSHNMRRIELLCSRCDGHLGHLFDDGPRPTGERHCINSASLRLVPEAGGE